MEVRKPASLESFLDFLVFHLEVPPFNINFFGVRLASKGDWLSFELGIGNYIETALDALLAPINAVLDLLDFIKVNWEAFWDLQTFLLGVISENISAVVMRIIKDVNGVYDFITGEVAELYQTIWAVILDVASIIPSVATMINDVVVVAIGGVMDWTLARIADLADTILEPWKQVLNTVSYFIDDINDLFSDPEEWLYNKIDSMLERFW